MGSGQAPVGAATISRSAMAAGLASLGAFIALSVMVGRQPVPTWESEVVSFAYDLPGWLMHVPRLLMHVSTRFTVPVLALAAYFVTLRWRAAGAVAAACVVGAVPVFIAKHAVSRDRPSTAEGFATRDDFYGSGYASGHMTIAVAAAAAVVPFLLVMPRDRKERRRSEAQLLAGEVAPHQIPTPTQLRSAAQLWLLASLPFVMAFSVGLARVYVGAHYPADLIGGALAGLAGAWLVLSLPHFHPATQSSIALLPEPAQTLFYRGRDLVQDVTRRPRQAGSPAPVTQEIRFSSHQGADQADQPRDHQEREARM